MSTYFVAYLQIKNKGTWKSVGPFTKEGELKPFYETVGTIRDIFNNNYENNFEHYREIAKEDFTSENFSPEILDTFKKVFDEPFYDIKYTSLAALHQYILIRPTIIIYDDHGDEVQIDNPVTNVYNRATDLLDMMGYYVFSALDEEDVRIVYFLG